ncbi:TPA: hypothetical protein ACXDAY_002135 [Clostridium botulinum]|uniref:hypothetical protein n=1 Tax=Clostridium botulinum TaxID=1491 RepID=UPI0004667233|nr:hypothetical protein [Clostridium botulinum]APR02432.1 hypothetical protein RSJ2_4052 [Clostridium botulinum]AUN01572.1 hypothetical protein RSJ19_00900 [Clostridium botulinum]MBN3359290.1 hypothetical protein [Clostridium botulinum]MBN3367115.1 hypothetical protein [Clostridium botulinum]MBN3375443.1 hypothetical protein [Clostridium botulinum]
MIKYKANDIKIHEVVDNITNNLLQIKVFYDTNSNFIHMHSEEDDFNVLYGNGMDLHWLQCNYQGDTKEYKQIQQLLDDISNKVRELYNLYK